MPGPLLPVSPLVKINGSDISKMLLEAMVSVRVESSVGSASKCELIFRDKDFEIMDAATFAVGSAVEVKFGADLAFKGDIVAIGIDNGASFTHNVVIEAYDKSYKLGRNSHFRTFLKSSYADMIKKIASEAGLQAETDPVLSDPVFEYFAQNDSDVTFIERIAARTGCEWHVDGTKLIVKRRPDLTPTATFTYGMNLIKFRARFGGSGHLAEVSTRSWDPKRKREITARDEAEAKYPTGGGSSGLIRAGRQGADGFGAAKMFRAGGFDTRKEAATAAAALGARQATQELVVRGEAFGATKLKARDCVEVKGVGTKLSGKYHITDVVHLFGEGGDMITRFTAGPLGGVALVDLLAPAPHAGDQWGASGLVIGLVTNNNDPDDLSRVKVKFPGRSDTEDSNWARVLSLGAGATRGFQVLPAVDDEVLVGFEQGDLRRPFVLGSLWNGKDAPPLQGDPVIKDGVVQAWTITSRLGHKVTLKDVDDDPAKDGIWIEHKDKKTKLILSGNKVQVLSNNKPIEFGDGVGTITFDGKGNLTIDAKKIDIKAATGYKLASDTGVEMKATTAAKIEGLTVEVKGQTTVKVEAGAMLTLKGAMTAIN